MTTNTTINSYNNFAHEYHERFKKGSDHTRELLDTFADSIPDEGVVLDIGCGTGIAMSDLSDRTPEDTTIHGVDLSEAMLNIARHTIQSERHEYNKPYVMKMDMRDLSPILDNTYDGVYSIAALQHIELGDSPFVFKEIARILKPGGVGFVSISSKNPDQPQPGGLITSSSYEKNDDPTTKMTRHFTEYNRDIIEQLVDTVGLSFDKRTLHEDNEIKKLQGVGLHTARFHKSL